MYRSALKNVRQLVVQLSDNNMPSQLRLGLGVYNPVDARHAGFLFRPRTGADTIVPILGAGTRARATRDAVAAATGEASRVGARRVFKAAVDTAQPFNVTVGAAQSNAAGAGAPATRLSQRGASLAFGGVASCEA